MADNNAMNGILGKLYAVMTSPDGIVNNPVKRSSSTSNAPPFIAFCAPGIAIDDLDFGDLTTQDQVNRCSAFSILVNSIPQPSGIWQQTQKTVWDIYQLAITDVTLPRDDLTAQEQATLKRAEDFLRQQVTVTDPFTLETKQDIRPTAAYQAYDSLFTAYGAALKAYNNSRITALSNPTPANVQDWSSNGPIYEQAVRNAYSRWGSLGYRDYVTEANGIISNLTGKGPFALYERLKSTFNLAERKDFTGRSFWSTFAYPQKILSPAFNDSWSTFTFSQNEIHQFESNSSSSWGGGVGVSFGLWSFGGGAQYSNSQHYDSCDTNNMALSVDLIQVPLERGWWSPWIFSSRGWKGGVTIGGPGSISSGSTPLSGFMPLVPTSMILARNLNISLDMTSTANSSHSSSVSTHASVGWGPFSVRGNYSRTSSSSSHDYVSTDSGLSCKGPQIIGFICDVLPMSPNPDPSLPWMNARERYMASKGANNENELWLEGAKWMP